LTERQSDHSAVPAVPRGPHPVWSTFVGWHREPTLWRDIYTRTVSGLVTVFVVYVVAAISGVVSRQPLLYIIAVVFAGSLIYFIVAVIQAVGIWRDVRPLFVRWNDDESPTAVRAKRVYNRLIWCGYLTIISGMFLAGAIATALHAH
jgi:hypothetical protein